jgi:hypothetical protein
MSVLINVLSKHIHKVFWLYFTGFYFPTMVGSCLRIIIAVTHPVSLWAVWQSVMILVVERESNWAPKPKQDGENDSDQKKMEIYMFATKIMQSTESLKTNMKIPSGLLFSIWIRMIIIIIIIIFFLFLFAWIYQKRFATEIFP